MKPSFYKTLAKEASAEFFDRRSKFIADAVPLNNEDNAQDYINKKRKEHWDSRHTVYAYVLQKGHIRRYSDDGEPQGTAGPPVLEVLQGEELVDSLIVVTRYFGGVLLGTGGLVRAYSQSSRLAIQSAGIVTMKLCDKIEIVCDYSLYGSIDASIPNYNGVILDTIYTDDVKIISLIPTENTSSFTTNIGNLSSGDIAPKKVGEQYYAFS